MCEERETWRQEAQRDGVGETEESDRENIKAVGRRVDQGLNVAGD